MKIGFHTNSLVWVGMNDLNKIAAWASENGFEDMEVGPNVPLKEELFNSVLEKGNIDISAFIYCRNFLSENKQEAAEHKKALMDRIEFAPKVGIKKIICSTGVNKDTIVDNNVLKYDPEASIDAVAEGFKEIVELAEKNNVKLCFENCPLMGNIAISPYMWERLFEKIVSDKVGLVFDPSHLVWQFINPYENILKFKDKIFHVHGKDCEVQYDKLAKYGILHNFSKKEDETKQGENAFEKMWWRYRLVGLGDLNWNRIIANLYEIGYDGTVSIEHEDPVWEGNVEKVKLGLIKAQKHLRSFL